MHRNLRNFLIFCISAIYFTSCNRLPDHAKYIPKDAVVVGTIDVKSLAKKIAWNVITGSKLFKEMQKGLPQKNANQAINDIDKSGIDFANTIYFYIKTDKRIKSGNRVSVLIPLSDESSLESYLKKVITKIEIKQKGERKECSINKIMYLAWNKKLLVVTNMMSNPEDYYEMQKIGIEENNAKSQLGETEISAEIDNIFNIQPENSLINNKHFKSLQTSGHDATLWVNYDQLMSQYMSGDVAEKMGGLALSNSLWKDAAFAAGFDFKSGKITGDMAYYVSDEIAEIGKAMGATNANLDMISRLPSQNLDILTTWHLSPEGLKKSLEKTGLLGLINIGLSSQGFTFDDALNAFSGDMAIVMNDLSVKTEIAEDNFMGKKIPYKTQKPNLNMTLAIKINKAANFRKIFDIYRESSGLQPTGTGNNSFIIGINSKDSVFVLLNDNYAVASNKYENAKGFIEGNFKSQKLKSDAAAQILNHPFAFFIDIQQLAKNIDANIAGNSRDSAIIAESKYLLNNISVNGGEFKNNAFESHMEIRFTNQDENSIIELMDYGMRLSQADKIKE